MVIQLDEVNHLRQVISNVVNDLTSKCSSDISTNITSVILFGSVARNDYVIGWSDIDLILILKHERNNFSSIKKLKQICDEIITNYRDNNTVKVYFFTKSICEKVLNRNYSTDIGVHLLVYTETEVDNLSRQDFPPLFLYAIQKDMKTLFGSNILKSLDLPSQITPQILLNSDMGLYDLRVRLRNTMLDYQLVDNPAIFGRDSIYCVLSAARNSLLLLGKDKFETHKDKIVDSFINFFSEFKGKKVVREAYELRVNFMQLNQNINYIENFYRKSLLFLDEFIGFIEKYTRTCTISSSHQNRERKRGPFYETMLSNSPR